VVAASLDVLHPKCRVYFLFLALFICCVAGSSASRMNSWQVEDITDNLAADLEGSLSGLGVDLSTTPYNMR